MRGTRRYNTTRFAIGPRSPERDSHSFEPRHDTSRRRPEERNQKPSNDDHTKDNRCSPLSGFSLISVALISHASDIRISRSEHPYSVAVESRVKRYVACSMRVFCCIRGIQRLSVSSRCPPKRESYSRLSTSVRRGRRWRNEPVAPRAPTQAPSRTNPPLPLTQAQPLLPIPYTRRSSMPEIRRARIHGK